MARVTPILTSFARGEIDPLLHGRTDLDHYHTGLAKCENFIPTEHGPVRHRPGTLFRAETKENTNVRLIPFRFSAATGQQYMLEFGNFYVRVHDWTEGVVADVTTPYTLAEVYDLRTEQSADVLWLVCATHPIHQLKRYAADTWEIVEWSLDDGPYMDENATDTTITPTWVEGEVALAASADLFDSGHIGALFRLYDPSGALNYPSWEAEEDYTAGALVKSNDHVYEAVTSGTSGTQDPLHTEGEASDGGITWAHRHNGSGTVRISWVTDARNASCTVLRRLPSTDATAYWQEGAWSEYRGYPTCVAFHQERLWFAATAGQPSTLWGSASANFIDFAPYGDNWAVLDDGAITKTLADSQADRVVWLASGQRLHIGTGAAEWTLGPAEGEVITPSAILRRATGRGSAEAVPVRLDNEIAFIQAGRRRLHLTYYDWSSDGQITSELSLWARHLTRPYLLEIAWAQEPWSCLWGRTADGRLIGCVYNKEQQVVAWHRHLLGGSSQSVEGLAVLTDGAEDRLWLLVSRTIDGRTRFFIEVMGSMHVPEDDYDVETAMHLDLASTHNGSQTSVMRYLDHLEGQSLTVVADGEVLSDMTVSDGIINLPASASVIHVGYARNATMTTMPIEAGAAAGSARPARARMSDLHVEVLTSYGGMASVNDGESFDLDIMRKKTELAPALIPPLYTGSVGLNGPRGWMEGPVQITVIQHQPFPFIVTGVGGKIAVNEG